MHLHALAHLLIAGLGGSHIQDAPAPLPGELLRELALAGAGAAQQQHHARVF
jgi:hypothetical protein